MTRPMTHSERVENLAWMTRLATNVNFGHRAWAERTDEMAGGYPNRGGGGGSFSHADATTEPPPRDDPAERAHRNFDKKLRKAIAALEELYELQAEGSVPRGGMRTIGDPGCQSCERVVNPQTGRAHWSPTHATLPIEREERKGKRLVVVKDQWRLCFWCYRFFVPSGQGRLPTLAEVQTHAEGRKVKVKAG